MGITCGVCLLESCEEALPNETSPEETQELRLGVDQIRTRALDDSFEVNDTIGVYAVKWQDETSPGDLLSYGNYADNVAFVLKDEADNWLNEEAVYYPADGSKLDIYAYYPYHREWINRDTTGIYFRVNPDQREYANYTASDFVTAKTTGVVRSTQKVHLTFDHKLSQLVFALKAGEGFTTNELADAKITIKNAIIDVTYNLAEGNDGTPVTGQERADALPTGEWQMPAEGGSLYGYKAIVAPQVLNQETYLEIKLGSRTFTQRFSNAIEMKSGESRLFTITVSNTELAVSTTLNPWNYQGGEIEGDASEEEVDPDAFIVEWEVGTGEAVLMSYLFTRAGSSLWIDWGGMELHLSK